MKQFTISEDLANAVYNYLMTRPMREVEGFVQGIRSLKESTASDTCHTVDQPVAEG